MADLRYPALCHINTRVWLTALSQKLGRLATLDDIPDADKEGPMGKRHTRISRAWQRPGCRGDCDGTGRTLLVGLVLFAWLAATPAAPTSAATSGSASPTTSDVDTPPEYLRAAVTLDGKVLFYVRGISSYPAERRAREISEKIRKIAADPSIAADSLRAVEGAEHTYCHRRPDCPDCAQ